ncbi:MAG: hypothetical protein Kilf2KO_10620 [Rhodospirillales bacterium]
MTPSGAGGAVLVAPGNPLRGDDGLGPAVAVRLAERLPGLPILTGAADTLRLLAFWEGARLAVAVDAALTGAAPGTLQRLDLLAQPLPKALARCSSHGLGLAEAIGLGRALDRLPCGLLLYAVEAESFVPGSGLCPAVATAAERLVTEIEAEIAALALQT